jgi:hypothetical protein
VLQHPRRRLRRNWPLPPWNHHNNAFISHDVHFNMTHQSDADACPMAEAHYHTNSQDQISEMLCGERDVGPTCAFTTSPDMGPGATIGTMQTEHPAYMLQAKTKGKAYAYALPCATVALEPISLLREGSNAITCPEALNPASSSRRCLALPRVLRLRTQPHHPGGVRRCHASLGTRPRLTAKEGSSADTRPSALDLISPKRGGLRCLHMSHGSLRAIEIKKGLAVTACNKTHVFLRHARVLPRHLQDVWVDSVIMTCKPCRHALQHRATVHHRVAYRSQAWRYSAGPHN